MFGCRSVGLHRRHAFDVRQNGHGSPASRTPSPEEPTAPICHGSQEQIERLLPKDYRLLLHSSTNLIIQLLPIFGGGSMAGWNIIMIIGVICWR